MQQAADQLGFRPSRLARSLRFQRSGLIGVVVPDISNPFFSSIAREITLRSAPDGFSVLLTDSQGDSAQEEKLIRELQSRQIEALVVCPVGVESQHLEDAYRNGLPMVLVDRVFPGAAFVQVSSDHIVGAEQASQLLVSAGHRKIGVLQGVPATFPNQQRLQGLRTAMQAVGERLDDRLIAGDDFTEASGYESARQLLTNHPDITALFAVSTPNAMGALRAAKECHRCVPEDLSIVTFDDSPFADLMKVPLSTAQQNVQKLGQLASRLILAQLEQNTPPEPALHLVPLEVINRNSIVRVESP